MHGSALRGSALHGSALRGHGLEANYAAPTRGMGASRGMASQGQDRAVERPSMTQAARRARRPPNAVLAGLPQRDVKATGRRPVPQQQNLKHYKIFDKQVHVLMPTEYQPQVDEMLDQNAALQAKKAQQAHKAVHPKHKLKQLDCSVLRASRGPWHLA